MSRPGYLNYKVTPKRQIWLAELCQRLGLNPNHKSYCDAIDTALAAMVAGVTKGEGDGIHNARAD